VAAVNTGNNLFYLLLAMMLSLIVMSGLLSEQSLRRLEFRRHLPTHVHANEPATATLTVTNRKSRVPSFSLRLLDVADGADVDRGIQLRYLPPQSSTLVSYIIHIPKRGRYRLDGINVVTPFPFGLFLKKRYYLSEATILIYPELLPLPTALLQDVRALGQDYSLARKGQGNSLYNLREYRPGDDSRAIHWMTTARTSKLMIKETEAEDQRWATIIVSLVAPPEQEAVFERALSVAASLIRYLQTQGYYIGMILGGTVIPFGTGEQHSVRLMQALALCERCDSTEMDAAHVSMWQVLDTPREGITVQVTSSPDVTWAKTRSRIDLSISPQSHKGLFDVPGARIPA
jgi:uncharacterized protein (DUF58 family)